MVGFSGVGGAEGGGAGGEGSADCGGRVFCSSGC